jgi:hypothetical protein
MRAHAEGNEMMAEAALVEIAAHDPLIDAGEHTTGQGRCQGLTIATRTVDLSQHIGAGAKTPDPKLEAIAKLADKFPVEPGSIFTGNAVLPTAPSGGGSFAGQQMGADAESDEMVAETALVEIAAHDPLIDAGKHATGQGKGQG